jgi:ketosteroid isomerase-like protein
MTAASPAAIFQRQLDCIMADDRAAQLRLYTEDLLYEFPYAPDRPRVIRGRAEFARVMTPLWDQARALGVKVTGSEHALHQTIDPERIVAEFTLAIEVGQKRGEMRFVQFLWMRGGLIAAVREYFNPQARSELI